jgi:transcriptional regulator with XRE-family HTH domain
LKIGETTNIVATSYLNAYYLGRLVTGLAMMKQRVYSKYAKEAAFLLGQHIKLGRKERQWSEQNLAARAGISRATLQKIEAGEMSPSIGLVFEVAALVGVPLFAQESRALATSIELTQSKIALLPKRIKNKTKVVDDDF